jgi:hypothetical protein
MCVKKYCVALRFSSLAVLRGNSHVLGGFDMPLRVLYGDVLLFRSRQVHLYSYAGFVIINCRVLLGQRGPTRRRRRCTTQSFHLQPTPSPRTNASYGGTRGCHCIVKITATAASTATGATESRSTVRDAMMAAATSVAAAVTTTTQTKCTNTKSKNQNQVDCPTRVVVRRHMIPRNNEEGILCGTYKYCIRYPRSIPRATPCRLRNSSVQSPTRWQ